MITLNVLDPMVSPNRANGCALLSPGSRLVSVVRIIEICFNSDDEARSSRIPGSAVVQGEA